MTKHLVVALSGGGLRGIYTNEVLHQIEVATGFAFTHTPSALVGSSVGGISALALGSGLGLRPQDVVTLLASQGRFIFSGSAWNSIKTLGGLIGPKYTADGLTRVLRDVFGSRNMTQQVIPTRVVSYNTVAKQPRVLGDSADSLSLVDAALATSAAPTFFPPHGEFIDGGCVANNPTVVALDFAEHLGIPLDSLRILSIGTGYSTAPIRAEASWGKAQWIEPLVEIFTDGVAQLAIREGYDILGQQNYMHIDTEMHAPFLDMDNTSQEAIAYWQKMAQQEVAARLPEIERFLSL